MKNQINRAIDVLKNGGIVIFPTDTAYGIGCRMDDEQAVTRLFEIRKRPESQATPVLVNGVEMAKDYLKPVDNEVIERLMNPYWPGALTIILPCKEEKIQSLVRGGGNNLGVRMPKHAVLLDIIKQVGVPILGPSANFHNNPTPFKFSDIDKNLLNMVDYALEGEDIEDNNQKASTVIDCSIKPWKIIRQGAIKLKIDNG